MGEQLGSSRVEGRFDRHLRDRALAIINSVRDAGDRNDFARAVKSMTDQTKHEYGGRFLHELVQNAYDQHPRDRSDGRILIRLDETEGEFGTVYVANFGDGFTEGDVRSICNLGLSSKPVGQGIGNKGVGFKSVFQVCAAPEIYSSDPTDGNADGFFFRFATAEDVLLLVEGDQAVAQQMLDSVSLFSIPIAIHEPPDVARELLRRGYATVLRLPLRTDVARREAALRLSELTDEVAPVLLFLRRISHLEIEHRTDDEEDLRVLTREAASISRDRGVAADRVSLSSGGDYLVFSVDVEDSRLRAALRAAVDAERLSEKWLNWEGVASVSVAVAAGREIDEWRTYTYLPMGSETKSPFAGHLNAPFFTDMARKGLDLDHPLNATLLDVAAEVALAAADLLLELGEEGHQAEVVDMISWRPDHTAHLHEAALRMRGAALVDLDIVPSSSGSSTSMSRGWKWPVNNLDVLTGALAILAAGAVLVPDDLGEARLNRLEISMRSVGATLDIPKNTLAGMVENMAAACLRARMSIARWDLLYDDLPWLFEPKDCKELEGRRILLTENGELSPCAVKGPQQGDAPRARAPFFPPVRQVTDDEDEVDDDVDLDPPASLQRRIAYLHSGLTWYEGNPRAQTKSRKYLQSNGLVHKFDARSLLDHVKSVASASASRRVHADALRFTFNLQRSKSRANLAVDDVGLRLETARGELVPANETLLSGGWPGSRAQLLELLSTAPADDAPELAALGDRLLPSPDQMLRANDDRVLWANFLRRLGVTDSLPPVVLPQNRTLDGDYLRRDHLTRVPGLPDGVAENWASALPTRSAATYRATPYIAKSALYYLPGQSEVHLLPSRMRQAYASLVLAAIPTWPESHFATTWERDRNGEKNPQTFPTPLSVFLSTAQWMPMHLPGEREDHFEHLAKSWYFPNTSNDGPPRYSPIISTAFRSQIDSPPATANRLSRAGMPIWTKDADARRLVAHLAQLLRDDQVHESQLSQLLRAYRSAWAASTNDQSPWLDPDRPDLVIVEISGQARTLEIEAHQGQQLVVAEMSDGHSGRRLIEEFGVPVLLSQSDATGAADALSSWGVDARRLTDLDVIVRADNVALEPTAASPLLTSAMQWLAPLLALLLEHRWPSQPPLSDRSLTEAQEQLARLRVVCADRLTVTINDDTLPLPPRMRGLLPIWDNDWPTVAMEGSLDAITWDQAETLAEPLMELIGRPQLVPVLKLALARLSRLGVPAYSIVPSDDDLAVACDVSVDDVERTIGGLREAHALVLERLYPVLAALVGFTNAEGFDPNQSILSSEESIIDALHDILAATDRADCPEADEMFRLAKNARDVDQLRRDVGLSLAEINETLAHLQPPQRLIDYTDSHHEQVALVVLAHWAQLSNEIRWSHLAAFQQRRPIEGWTTVRDRSELRPDAAWGTTLDTLDESLIMEHVRGQLRALSDGAWAATGPTLKPMNEVHARNVDRIDQIASQLGTLVRAWSQKHDLAVHPAIADPTNVHGLRDALDPVGALDFVELERDDIVAWTTAIGAWPTEMPESLDTNDLELDHDDLQQARNDADRLKAERLKARRTITVASTPIDLTDGYAQLRDALTASLERQPGFVNTRARFVQLDPATEHRTKPTNRERQATGGSTQRASDVQLNGIGFAGEWLAAEWLARRHKENYTDECWKSTNRASFCTGFLGDDGLGYDFAVPSPGGALLYEVKATSGQPGELMLGQSEVETAQENSGNDRWRLLVITQALSDSREIFMLHNPFSTRSRGQFSFASRGLRLRYRIPDR